MISKIDVSNIKTEIDTKIGQKIIIKGSHGRNKPFEEEAIIEKAYPNFFIVKNEEKKANNTHSYVDILTKNLQIEIYNGESYCPLIIP